ncbi:unnamed protein product [Prorocentrum cordatum]|uniref:Retrovirus-related Pol polyprotein from transposon TNT 1-94 n=1 Tax=Prorocentrum cordatum TaxID=2364126 RepID=A0ABN9PSP1_9DINO|nr:unnamed protein product [Polarella glacialis]
MEALTQRLAQLEEQQRQQRTVIETQQAQLTAAQNELAAVRAAGNGAAAQQPAGEARAGAPISLVDLRVGNKPEVFTGDAKEWKNWSFKMRQYLSAIDETLRAEVLDVDVNPSRELTMNDMAAEAQRRARQLAFILTMHTKDVALQMVTKLPDPSNGYEIWRRFLEEFEPAHKGRFRAMLMQILQYQFTGDRGLAIEEFERLVRQYEAQSGDIIQETIKAAVISNNPEDPEWRRHVGLNATRLQDYTSLKDEWKAVHQAERRWGVDGDSAPMEVDALTSKGKGKDGGKGKGKDGGRGKGKGDGKGKDGGRGKGKGDGKDKNKVEASKKERKCFFCKEKGHERKDCPKFTTWLEEKKKAGHAGGSGTAAAVNTVQQDDGWVFMVDEELEGDELCELIMIDSGASANVCPRDHVSENGLREEAHPRRMTTATGELIAQHGRRRVSYETEFGKITTDYRVLDVKRPIWSLGAMVESGCDAYFTKGKSWIVKDGKELELIRKGNLFYAIARPSKIGGSDALELNPLTQAEIEQRALAREHAAFGAAGPAAEATLAEDGDPAVRIKVPTGPATPTAEERAQHESAGHVPYRSWCSHCVAARAADKPHRRSEDPTGLSAEEAAIPRIEFDFAEIGRESDASPGIPSLNGVDVGSESLSATLCPSKAFSEYLVETILAFVDALGHNAVLLHSDQEPVLVQLLKAVQSKRVKRTLVRHGPRGSHQSQGKIEGANRVINGVLRAIWINMEEHMGEKVSTDSILIAWGVRHAAWSLTRFQVKSDGRTPYVRIFGKAYGGEVLPFGERVMYKYTAVPSGNLDQKWAHGVWVGKAPLTDEHLVLTVDGVKKARSVHRLPVDERYVKEELAKVKGLPWNGTASDLKAPIVSQQDQGPSGHRRLYLTRAIVQKYGATPGCSGCAGLGPHTEACRARLEKLVADAAAGPRGIAVGTPLTARPDPGPPAGAAEPSSAASGDAPRTPAGGDGGRGAAAEGMEVDRADTSPRRGRSAAEAFPQAAPERPTAKVRSQPPVAIPAVGGAGTVVVSESEARSSTDDVMIGGLHVIDGVDVVAMLIPEEDEWRLAAMDDSNYETISDDSQSDMIGEVNYEDPASAEGIVAYDSRTGEQLDSEEVRKGRSKELRDLADSLPNEDDMVEVAESRDESKEGEIWTNRVGWRTRKFVRLILAWAASYSPRRNSAGAKMILLLFDISVAFFHGLVRKVLYVVPPKDLRKKGKVWGLLRSLYGTRDASQVFQTYVADNLSEHGFDRNAVVPCLYWSCELEALGVHWGDDFIYALPNDSADDLEQLMREVFKVKICERVGPNCKSSAAFLHRTLSWSSKGFTWAHDPTHTVAMAKAFGFDGQTRLDQEKWVVTVAPGSKTVGKTRDAADPLDEEGTALYRALVGTALYVGQDRPEAQYATKEVARYMSTPTRSAWCALKRLCKYYSEVPLLVWEFNYQKMPEDVRVVTDANWAGELEALRSTSAGWVYFGSHLLEAYSSTQQIVALSTAESEYISITKGAAHALEVRSALAEYGWVKKVICEADSSAGRSMATRRGVGRVRHLDARLLWLQELCADGTIEMRVKPGESNEADLGTKMVDIQRVTKLMKTTSLRPPGGWGCWVVAAACEKATAANDCSVGLYKYDGAMDRTSGSVFESWVLVALIGMGVLLLFLGLACGYAVGRCCSPRSATGERRCVESTQTEELEIIPYWEWLLNDLQKELLTRGVKAIPKLKGHCVQKLLEIDQDYSLTDAESTCD